jgi:hypothetical protein
VPVACEEGIKRGGAEAAVFSQIIAADDFLTFKRMMHARSASLDFQAHLQYEKIRSAALPGTAAAAMEMCGQQVVSRNHEHHQQLIQQHQLQQSQQSGSCVAPPASSPPRNPYAAHSADSDESQDDDERMLQQAIGDSNFSMFECSIRVFCIQSMFAELSKLAFEELRSQVQQEEDDIETAVRLSILEAEDHSRRLQKERQDARASAAVSSVIHSEVSESQADSWQMELEAARQREQQVHPPDPIYSDQ